jgi:hypothetical protein
MMAQVSEYSIIAYQRNPGLWRERCGRFYATMDSAWTLVLQSLGFGGSKFSDGLFGCKLGF